MAAEKPGADAGRTEGLQKKFLIIATLVVILPSLFMFYIFYSGHITVRYSYILIFALILLLALTGLIILRLAFENMLAISDSIRRSTETGEMVSVDIREHVSELKEISLSFNKLMQKLDQTMEALNRRIFELNALKELTELASRTLNMDELLQVVLDKALIVTGARTGSVLRLDPGTGQFRRIALRDGLETDKEKLPPEDDPASLTLPITIGQDLIATLTLALPQAEGTFDNDARRILSIMLGEIGFALGNAQLHAAAAENFKKIEEKNLMLMEEIAERRHIEAALRESEGLFHSLVDNMLDTTLILDWGGVILFANQAGAKLVALNTAAEGVGMNVIDFIHPDSHGAVISDQSKVWEGRGGFLAEYRLNTLTGDQKWVESLGTKITFRGQPANLVTIRDITTRKAVEKELLNTLTELRDTKDLLVQSEKLAAIGRLSAGVAHEILNPVNIISMRLQLLETIDTLPEDVLKTLEIFKDQLQRITGITKDLSQFSRLSRKHEQLNDLNGLIEQVLTFSAPLLSMEKVSMELQLDPDIPELFLDKDRIGQVLFNIIINAVTAMEDRQNKCIRIATDRIEGDSGEVFLRIAIADNGHGIRDEDRTHLFDPFFTTRQPGKGTGLGLFISYGIVHDHGGRIWAENNEWGGASFYIQLPLDGSGQQTPPRFTDRSL